MILKKCFLIFPQGCNTSQTLQYPSFLPSHWFTHVIHSSDSSQITYYLTEISSFPHFLSPFILNHFITADSFVHISSSLTFSPPLSPHATGGWKVPLISWQTHTSLPQQQISLRTQRVRRPVTHSAQITIAWGQSDYHIRLSLFSFLSSSLPSHIKHILLSALNRQPIKKENSLTHTTSFTHTHTLNNTSQFQCLCLERPFNHTDPLINIKINKQTLILMNYACQDLHTCWIIMHTHSLTSWLTRRK